MDHRMSVVSGSLFDAVRGLGDHALVDEKLNKGKLATMEKLPDKALLNIFSYLHHREVLKCAQVCKKWRQIAYDSKLWKVVSFRPDFNGLSTSNVDALIALIGARFGPALRLIELPTDLIQPPILHELANKCPKLQYMTLDFSTAVQLHEFNDLQSFPPRLRSLTICLSEVIFLESFIRRVYTFISSVEVLHLIGTYEKIEDEEEEVFEVLNLHKLKAHTPNLRVINLWGVAFITDEHIESLSSNCAHLEVFSVNFCTKVKGSALKLLMQRCKKLKTLLMEQCSLESKNIIAVDWEKSGIQEINVTATDLSQEALISLVTRTPHLRWLSAGYLENFTDTVMDEWVGSGSHKSLVALDLSFCDSLTDNVLSEFLSHVGSQLQGLIFSGLPTLTEHFWLANLPKLRNIKIISIGVAEDCCQKVTSKIHVDQVMDNMATNCNKIERLAILWDPETLRFSEKSSKFIDILRMRCLRLHALVLTDGQYFELVKSNFERAERWSTVRASTCCQTTIAHLLLNYNDLLFN